MGIFSNDVINDGNELHPAKDLFPPDIITSRNIGDIENLMAKSELAAKLCGSAAASCKLPDLKKEFESIQKDHLKHLADLTDFLKKEKEAAQ